jgi:large subunit ribosomal protein L10
MKRKEKPTFVKKLTDNIKESNSVVLVDYAGLSVKLQQELKKRLKTVGGKMIVAKNSLFKIAGEKAKLPEELLTDTVLVGPTAYVFATGDSIAPLQILNKFAKEFELPSLKVGIIDGKFQGKETLEKLATLPSREVLLGTAVGTIAGPLYGIVSVLNANMQKLVYILSAKAKQG